MNQNYTDFGIDDSTSDTDSIFCVAGKVRARENISLSANDMQVQLACMITTATPAGGGVQIEAKAADGPGRS